MSTIRYSFPDDPKFRYMSFETTQKAEKCIELFKQIDVKAELNVIPRGKLLWLN